MVSPDVILESVEAGSVKVISSASINPDPVSPNTMRNTAMGGVAGLVISLGIIFLTVLLDNKINTEEEQELAAAFGIRSIPTLLFIPMEGKPQMAQGALPKASLKEAIDKVMLGK